MNGLGILKNNRGYQTQGNNISPIDALPLELLMKCLSFLPKEDIGNASRACKYWNQVLSDPYYATIRFGSKKIISINEMNSICKKLKIEKTDLLLKCKSLETINFNDFTFTSKASKPFKKTLILINAVKNLVFKSCHFKNITTFSSIGSICKQLESLELARCVVSFDQLHFLNRLEFFKKLSINDCNKFNNTDFLSGLVKLKELKVFKANLITVNSLNGLKKLSQIEKLSLMDCGLKDISKLSKLENLTYIHLFFNPQLKDISPLKHLQNLNYINVSGCISLTDISCLENMKLLNTISLLKCDDITSISSLFNLPNLVKIKGCAKITDDEQKFKLITTVVSNIANHFKNENTSFAMEAFLELPLHIKNEIYQELYDTRKDKPLITDPKFGELCFHQRDDHKTTNLERYSVMISYLEKYNYHLTRITEIYRIFDLSAPRYELASEYNPFPEKENPQEIERGMELFNQLPQNIKNDIYFIAFEWLKKVMESENPEAFNEPNYGQYCFHRINGYDMKNWIRNQSLKSYINRYVFH